jgi:SAM-dependent methyltransferase
MDDESDVTIEPFSFSFGNDDGVDTAKPVDDNKDALSSSSSSSLSSAAAAGVQLIVAETIDAPLGVFSGDEGFDGATNDASFAPEDLVVGGWHARKTTLKPAALRDDERSSATLKAIVADSDVVPSVYEGGFKVWECAIDMITFLQEQQQASLSLSSLSSSSSSSSSVSSSAAAVARVDVHGKRVVDLGCGSGLPGIYCLLNGASKVAFQDLNREVLSLITIPNVALNTIDNQDDDNDDDGMVAPSSASPRELTVFCSGDWRQDDLVARLGAASFDVILTSDTLYSSASLPLLLAIMKRLLTKSPMAVALVAAKRYYFGIGGSVGEFLGMVDGDKEIEGSVVRSFEDGQSNIRDIIEVKWSPEQLASLESPGI